jgi:hypothetical protein
MSTDPRSEVSRPLWWGAWTVLLAALGMLIWLWVQPLPTTADLPGQTPLHDVSGR